MKRILVILLVFMAASALLFASGKQEKATGEGSFEGMELVIMSAGDGSKEFRIISPWLPEFEKRYGVKVNWNEMSIGNLHTRLATLFAAQSPEADIVWTGHKFTAEFAAAGGLLDVTDRLPQDLIGDLTAAKGAVTYNDRIYGVPKFGSNRFFYHNKILFRDAGLDPDKAPVAWDEFVDFAEKTTKGDSQWGFLPTGAGDGDNAVMDYQLFYYMAGGDSLFDQNDRPTFNSATGIDALEKYAELYDLGVIDPASWTIDSGTDRRGRWMAGQTAMVSEWPSLWKQANDPGGPSKVIGEVGISTGPKIKRPAGLSGDEAYAVSAYSKRKDLALEFLKFLGSEEVQKDICLRTGWLPVRQAVLNDPEVQNNEDIKPMIDAAIRMGEVGYLNRFSARYSTEVENEALGVAIIQVVKNEKSASEALAWAEEKCEDIVAKYKR